MQALILLACVAAVLSAPAQLNFLCTPAQDAENFLKPGFQDQFDAQCVPQIAAQIQACSGPLQQQAQQAADQLCSEVQNILIGLLDKLPSWLSDPIVKIISSQTVVAMCDKDLGTQLLNEINQECSSITGLDPKALCNQSFNQVWSQLTNAINQQLCSN